MWQQYLHTNLVLRALWSGKSGTGSAEHTNFSKGSVRNSIFFTHIESGPKTLGVHHGQKVIDFEHFRVDIFSGLPTKNLG